MTEPPVPNVKELRYYYEATILRWVDADTVHLSIDLGINISKKEIIRLYGINAYERNTVRGQQGMAWLRAVAPVGTQVMIHTYLDQDDKYGRLLGTLWHAPGSEPSLNDQLVEMDYAIYKEYR